jgi:hypothetical protein
MNDKKICLIRVKHPDYFNMSLKGVGSLNNYIYLVPFVFNGEKSFLLLTTENQFSKIHFSFAVRTGARISRRNMIEFVDFANTRKKHSLVQYKSFSVDRFSVNEEFKAFSTYFDQKKLYCSKIKSIKISGYLGVHFLMKYDAVIDFGNRALYLYLPDRDERG